MLKNTNCYEISKSISSVHKESIISTVQRNIPITQKIKRLFERGTHAQNINIFPWEVR